MTETLPRNNPRTDGWPEERDVKIGLLKVGERGLAVMDEMDGFAVPAKAVSVTVEPAVTVAKIVLVERPATTAARLMNGITMPIAMTIEINTINDYEEDK